jgi:hypothetical protein
MWSELTEAVNWRTDNAIQRPKEKGQTMIYKTLHRKLKIEQHEPH